MVCFTEITCTYKPATYVGAFDVCVLVFSATAIFLASVHGTCLRYTEDFDVVFTKKNNSLSTLERRQLIRMLCDSSNLYKQKLVKPKPLASKMDKKNRTSGAGCIKM